MNTLHCGQRGSGTVLKLLGAPLCPESGPEGRIKAQCALHDCLHPPGPLLHHLRPDRPVGGHPRRARHSTTDIGLRPVIKNDLTGSRKGGHEPGDHFR